MRLHQAVRVQPIDPTDMGMNWFGAANESFDLLFAFLFFCDCKVLAKVSITRSLDPVPLEGRLEPRKVTHLVDDCDEKL
jgi:hypothetical protein